jgi:hypothetical protein
MKFVVLYCIYLFLQNVYNIFLFILYYIHLIVETTNNGVILYLLIHYINDRNIELEHLYDEIPNNYYFQDINNDIVYVNH